MFVRLLLLLSALIFGASGVARDGIAASAPQPEPSAYRTISWNKPALRTFYASPAGTGTGRSRAAPRAFAKLLPTLRPGDRVILLPGSYPPATLSIRGTVTRPIRIEAETPAVQGQKVLPGRLRAAFRRGGLQLRDTRFVRIRGLSFENPRGGNGNGIEVLTGRDLAFVQNYFHQSANFGLLMFGKSATDVRQVLVEGNLFRNRIAEREAGGIGNVQTDYGLRIHGTTTLVARGNLFDGLFNHAVSVKEKARDILIERNRFVTCGTICIEGGQEPDTAHGGTRIDRTVAKVNIRNNRFDGADDNSTGVFARNVERIYVTGNRFSRIRYPLRVQGNALNARSCERQLQTIGRKLATCEPGSRLTLAGRRTSAVLFDRNHITGRSMIHLVGRGHAGDTVWLRNTWSDRTINVSVRGFVPNPARVNGWTAGTRLVRTAPAVKVFRSPTLLLKR